MFLLFGKTGLYEWFEKWVDKPVRNRGEDYMEFKDKLTAHLMVSPKYSSMHTTSMLTFEATLTLINYYS